MATHSCVLAWRIPGTGEPGGLPSMGSHRVGHDWSNLAAAAYIGCVLKFWLLSNKTLLCKNGSSQTKLYFVRTITIDSYLTLYKGARRGNLLTKHTTFLFLKNHSSLFSASKQQAPASLCPSAHSLLGSPFPPFRFHQLWGFSILLFFYITLISEPTI